ncbi:MAG: hypothetical protein Q9196_000687 [Gyalolechia fulgens]
MGCRWPGSVRDAPGLWELLRNKRSGYREFDEPRFSAKGFHHPNPDRPGTMTTKGGFLVADDPRLFDAAFFGMTGLEVETMDASQRKLLEVIYEAFENAGETWESISGSRTGVFVGTFSLDHWLMQARDWDYPRSYATTGASTSILSNRISYMFNLRGPSLSIDTACSSSMYAIHLAINSIRNGDCDSAIVAGANWIADPSLQIALNKLGALSPTSTCHTFDASADGYARGEGFAALYFKKLSQAVHDGSPIRALVRGTAVNANGRTGGITRPSAAGQEAVIRKAYSNAGNLSLADTTYFEIHGTGTPVGDPIEVSAVGSVKTNLGHTEGASALAGIMKVVLALEMGAIPASIGVETLNPAIDFDKAKAKVVRDLIPWPKDRLRRASINSFGFGGANGHCILDHVNNVLPGYVKPGMVSQRADTPRSSGQTTNGHIQNGHIQNGHIQNGHIQNGHIPNAKALNGSTSNGHILNDHITNGSTHKQQNRNPQSLHLPVVNRPKITQKADATTRQLVLLPFSAHNETSLKLNINALSRVITQHSMADVAYTLSAKRSRFYQRSFRVVDKDNAVQGLGADQRVFSSQSQPANVGFVFTGQGAQWHGMGTELFQYRVFRAAIDYLDYILGTLPTPPSWTLKDILCGDCNEDRVQTPEISQTACTAVQIGLVDVLASWSVRPSGVVGHSSGEMAAAYAAGRSTAAETITAAYFRGRAVSKNKQDGAMLAVGLAPEQIYEYLLGQEEGVKIAAINSPNSITLSGDVNAIERLSATLKKDEVFCRKLQTGGNAYHSHHMIPLGSDYSKILSTGLKSITRLDGERQRYSQVPWFSSVTPHKSMSELEIAAPYWRANLESPVRFLDAVSNLVSAESPAIDILVEIGPHPALKSPLNQILTSLGKNVPYTSSLKRDEDGSSMLLQLAGSLFSLNAQIDLVAVNSVDNPNGTELEFLHGCSAVDLPPYQYSYGPVNYHESRVSKEYRLRKVPRHDLIGSKVAGTAKLQPQWRNILRLKDLPWLGEHRLLPHAVFPAAGYIAMATAAASQAYREFEDPLQIRGYSLQNVAIKTALKIPEDDYGVEIILSMDLEDTATATSPAWATFTVSSVARNSDQWTEHCAGLVRIEVSEPEELDRMSTVMDSRTVHARTWYTKFAEIGLGYGPAFQGLSEIRADPDQSLASAKLALKTTAGTIRGGESSYPLHPASLDATFQLALIACQGGQVDKTSTAFVPVHLNDLYIRDGNDQDWGTAVARGELRGLRGAYAKLQLVNQSGDVVLDIDNLRCISYSESKSPHSAQTKAFSSPFTRLENVSRVSFFDSIHSIAHLIVVDIYENFASSGDGPKPSGNLGHFLAWIRRQVKGEKTESFIKAKQLSSQGRLQMLQQLYSKTDHIIEVKIMKRLHENMQEILQERRTGVDVLVDDGLLTALYESGFFMIGAYPQLFNLMDSLAHSNPNLSILELGAGTGGATRVVMKALSGPNSIKRYGTYTFTDLSPGFLTAARESMADLFDVNFSVCDIERDPLAQGYEPIYDVVMASQTLHATASISKTLANCRRLLKPGGKLVLVENTQINVLSGLVLGTLTGYWHGIPDGRIDSPFMSVESWDSALLKAGFSGSEIVLEDYPQPHSTTNILVSTVLDPNATRQGVPIGNKKTSEVQLLHGVKGPPALLSHLAKELEHHGVLSKAGTLDKAMDTVSRSSHVIAFLDGENLMMDADDHHLKVFQHLSRSTASFVCMTACGMVKGRNPDGALIAGLLRTIGTENPASRFLSIDIDAEGFDIDDKDLVRGIVDQALVLQQQLSDESEDREFVWQDGCMWVSRLVPDSGLQKYSEITSTPTNRGTELLPLDSQGPVRAAFEVPGILSSLYFKPYTELWEPLPQDCIEIKVAAVGLNWKDLGLSSGRFDGNNLSSEYSGVVSKTGSDVTNVSVGDHVYGMGRGHFGNYTRVQAAFAQKLLPSDNLVEVATMPLVYMTAVYAFEHVTRLRKGQKVLIQSATGGLGLAAVQIAQLKGAEVFATVGSADKAKFLADTMNVPSSHIFSSRSLSDLPQAVRTTRNRGFDVILSTAKGDMLYASVKALAPLGCLVDVGRMDVMDAKTIGLELFQKSANFSSFDLGLVLDSDPVVGGKLMQTVNEYYRAGHIAPIRPFSAADISQLDQVLLGFSKGTHIGKLVMTFQNPDSMVKMISPAPAARFDPKARYVMTGGMGGLGRSMIRWMCDRGAQDIAILSRRGANSPEAKMLVDTLAARGISIRPVRCDVSKREQVMRTIQEISADKPVKGIIHSAVSYQDLTFDKLTIDRWHESLAAKVVGTKILHDATLSLPLDFFVMTTSLESVCALATQSAYTAANNFQDLFARYRRRCGLPASTASFGFVNDLGSLSADSITVDMFARNKVMTITEPQFFSLLEPAFLDNERTESAPPWIGKQHDPLSASTFITCLDPAAMAARKRNETESGLPSGPTPRWYSDGRVSLIMRAFDDAVRHGGDSTAQAAADQGGKSAVTRLRREFDAAVQKADPEEKAKTVTLVTGAIVTVVAEMLFIDGSGIDPVRTVADLGVDSLIAAELRNWFRVALGYDISMLDLLDAHTSINALAANIVEKRLAEAAT